MARSDSPSTTCKTLEVGEAGRVPHGGTVVDLADELWGPMGEPLRDPAYFRQVRVDAELRTVVWPNGFDLDPDVLHGRRSHDLAPAATRQSTAEQITGLTLSERAGALVVEAGL